MNHDVPVQSLIDHIKTATDVDPWAKEMAEELLKEREAVPAIQREVMNLLVWCCGSCGVVITHGDKFCRMCGRAVKWG